MKNKKGTSLAIRNTLVGYSFILPNFIGFALFVLIPVLVSFCLSFMEWDGFNPMQFVRLENFKSIFGDRVFKGSLNITVTYTFFAVALTLVASLLLAIALNVKVKFTGIFRTAIFFPYIASIVAVGAVWKQLFEKNFGPINSLLISLGIEHVPGWFASTKWAIWGIIIVTVWKSMGYYMIIYLAALQDIPPQLYEAATIDGVNKWQKFRHVTFPMLTPATFFVLIMLVINNFKSFDLVYVLTEGGPGTSTTVLVKYIYDQSFIYWDFGKASASSMVLFLIVGIITIIQFRTEKKFTDYL